MPVYQEKDKSKWTKDGRSWHFRVNYVNDFNESKQKESKLFLTKKEALEEERKFLLINDHKQNNTKMTFDNLYDEYEKYLSITKNKSSSIYSDYLNYQNHIQPNLGKMDISKISLQTIRSFHTIINEKTYIKNNTEYLYGHKFKTKLHSLLSCILDYGVTMGYLEENMAKRHGNFRCVNDEVTIEKEKIKYQTPTQFNNFMAFVNDNLWKAFFNVSILDRS
ncbi:MAG: Arm DNA-binding domain-containing protein [Bacilli bacterium]